MDAALLFARFLVDAIKGSPTFLEDAHHVSSNWPRFSLFYQSLTFHRPLNSCHRPCLGSWSANRKTILGLSPGSQLSLHPLLLVSDGELDLSSGD